MRKTEEGNLLRLGIFTIFGIALFVVAVYFIGNKQGLLGKMNYLYAKFEYVSGLQPGNNVRYLGVNAGNVKKIEIINDTTILIKMAINSNVFRFIKKDAIATVNSDGLVGSMIIDITSGKSKAEFVKDGDTIKAQGNVKLEDLLRTLSVTNDNIAAISKDLLKITGQINEGKGTIGLLLNDTLMGKDVKLSIAQIKSSATQLSGTAKEIDKMVKSLNNNNNVIGILKDTIIPDKVHKLVDDVAGAGKELEQTINNVNQFVLDIKQGDGALNYFTKDPNLVMQLDSIITNVNKASKSLNENMEALKHNFLFRGYFKKQEKKAEKSK